MNLRRCERGHFYDAERWNRCPHCDNSYLENDSLNLSGSTLDIFDVENEEIGDAWAEDLTEYERIPSVTKKVIVYQDGAILLREAKFHLSAGSHKLWFFGLSDTLLRTSIQISMQDGLSFNQFCYIPQLSDKDMENESEEIRAMRSNIETIEARIDAADVTLKLLRKQTGKNKLDLFSNEAVENYSSFVSFIQKKCNELNEEIIGLKKQLEEAVTDLNKELGKQNRKKIPSGAILADVKAEADGDYQVVLTYCCSRVSWRPSYEIYVNNENEPMTVMLKGAVSQSTNDDWENVELLLSTGNIMHYNFQSRVLESLKLRKAASAAVSVPRLLSEDTANLAEYLSHGQAEANEDAVENIPQYNETTLQFWDADSDNEIQETQTLIEYRIAGNHTIRAGSENVMFAIANNSLKAEYVYCVTPEISNVVYLAANVQGWENAIPIDGEASVFVNHRFNGRTHIYRQNLEKSPILWLGDDAGIMVLKKKDYQYSSKKRFGGVYRKEFEYSILVKNMKRTPVQIMLTDRVPVSEDEKIRVEIMEISQAAIEENTGILTWQLALKEHSEKILKVKFRVSWPEDYVVDIR